MRPNPILSAFWLAAVAFAASLSGALAAQEAAPRGGAPFALSDTVAVQDVSTAVKRYRADLGAGTAKPGAAAARASGLWFGLELANPTSLPVERLLVIGRPLLAGAGWSVGTARALPQGPAVKWVGAGAPEILPALPGTGGASVYQFVIPARGTARLAIPGAEGPAIAAVKTRAAYTGSSSFRFVILGLGFGLLGVLAALSFARWLGAGDRAAAASASVGLAAIWVLATQFGHHLPLIGAESPLDPGLKAAGLFLLAGALLYSVRMQTALSRHFLNVLTYSALACTALAVAALPVGAVAVAAGPVLLAAALLALGAAVTDALHHRERLRVRLPDLAGLTVLSGVLIVAAVLAAVEPSLAADRWSMALHGLAIVSLAVLGGSGLVVHHGVAVPLLSEYHPPAPERAKEETAPALGPEPAGADLSALEIPPDPGRTAPSGTGRQAVAAADAVDPDKEMIRDLRAALANREIRVEYQPIVALTDGSIAGFEALARWEREGHGAVPPGEFIPLAEEAGLIGELGGQVLEEAARRLGQWQRSPGGKGTKLRMNVNLSAKQLETPGLAGTVRAIAGREGLQPGTLTLELTEGAKLADPGEAAETLRRLKDAGALLVLDDFGTGYSSLDVLRRMPFDGLKIDRSFLDETGDERAGRIVASVISLAHDLGMTVTAEGVRTASDLERLRSLGCDYVQGPLCGRPLPATSAGAVLQRDESSGGKEEDAKPFSAGSA
ncbi:MAG: putative bifunctional diguanylate cyclase/phosphodiesterase [Alphaproteobacteria bacterium]